jgi:hypothetical protein
MKPGDHPDFYRIAPPPGTSRESTIVLDAEGKFWHDGQPVDHPSLEKALHSWITRHPEDGRFILTNGYDWTYFEVKDAPYVVRALRSVEGGLMLELSDDSEEPLAPETLRVGRGDALYVAVKGGRFEARFSRHAQTALAPFLHEEGDGSLRLRIGTRDVPLPPPRRVK